MCPWGHFLPAGDGQPARTATSMQRLLAALWVVAYGTAQFGAPLTIALSATFESRATSAGPSADAASACGVARCCCGPNCGGCGCRPAGADTAPASSPVVLTTCLGGSKGAVPPVGCEARLPSSDVRCLFPPVETTESMVPDGDAEPEQFRPPPRDKIPIRPLLA